jgi:hypothetical protein
MATKTAGTTSTSQLTAIQADPSVAAISAADMATIANDILTDNPRSAGPNLPGGASNAIYPSAFSFNGLLFIPNRGVLKVLPGDFVAVDKAGWPILLSSKTLPKTLTLTGNTTSSSPNLTNLSASAWAAGWEVGTPISGTGIASNTVISSIAANGLSLVMSKNAASPQTGTTVTAGGGWTHS